jgi:hypothetical protein
VADRLTGLVEHVLEFQSDDFEQGGDAFVIGGRKRGEETVLSRRRTISCAGRGFLDHL